jgi:pentose-5-phosphate-3-epimerase
MEAPENIPDKFDQRLMEAIKHAEKGGVNPYFAVDAIVDGNYTDDMVSQLEAKGVDVIYGERNILRIRVTPKNLRDIKDLGFVKNYVLIAENYYPNK